jgi:hypothetical protein
MQPERAGAVFNVINGVRGGGKVRAQAVGCGEGGGGV